MKKLIFGSMALIAFLSMIFFSCEKDDESGKHEYTPEELAEIHRQDSLKQIIPASYVFTQDVTIPLTDDYSGVTVCLTPDTVKLLELFEYNTVAELVAALGTLDAGVQSGNDITFYAYNYSTKYEVTNPSTTNYFGHWFDANGDVCNWGDQAYLFCEKEDETTLNFTIACYPSRPAEGSTYTIVEAMKYDTMSVAFLFNVTIGEPPEVVYPVTTVVGTKTYDIEAEKSNDYSAVPVSIDAAAITAAIGIAPGDAEIYGIDISDDSLYVYGSTAEDPGYWFNATGDVCHWGDDGCAIYANYIIADELFNVGQYPDGTTVGETYTVKIAFVNLSSLQQYNVVINVEITAFYPVTTIAGIETHDITAAVDTNYAPTTVAIDTAAIIAAIDIAPQNATMYGINASNDSLYVFGSTATDPGYWFNETGDVCTWGSAGCAIYAEYNAADQVYNIGQFPHGTTVGTTYTVKMAFVNLDNLKQYNIVINLTVTAK
jgi:hypothetical protein